MSKKENDAAQVTSVQIDNAISEAGDKFTVASILKTLGFPKSDALRRRITRTIENDVTYFYDDKWKCVTRKSFFNGRKFLITPDDWEICEGIIFPGHRFVPFVSDEVFPSEVELTIAGKTVAKRKLNAPLGKIFHYHILLGSEQVFDFLLAEDPANAVLVKSAAATSTVSLEVFDLKDFFAVNSFAFGDALLCTVDDYENGKISVGYLPGTERSNAARKAHIGQWDEAMRQVWELFGDYADIPEQLAWAEFFAGSYTPGASTDELISSSGVVELRPDGDHAVLSIRDREADFCQSASLELPEGLTISENALDDPFKILSGAGSPLSAAELDAFMLDAIYGRESEPDGVFSRIFSHRELDLEDEAQQAVLLNFLEERFEDLQANYNRVDDEPKAELRSQLLEAVSARLDYLAFLGSLDREVNDAERQKLHKLAAIGSKIGELLNLLNNPAFTPDAIELSTLETQVEERLSEQDELLGDFRSGE